MFFLETAANLPQSPETKPEPEKPKSATVVKVKTRPAPLERKPAVPPKPSKILLANPAKKTTSGVATNLLKPKTSAMKRPKIKSPFLPSPGKILIPVKKAGGVKEASPAPLKIPARTEVSVRKPVVSPTGGTGATARPGLTSSGSKPSRDVGRRSLVAASGQKRAGVTTTAPAKSPVTAKTGLARSGSVGSSSSLQRRRKSVGDAIKSSSLATRKPLGSSTPANTGKSLSAARLASQPGRSLSNSSLKRSSEAASRAQAGAPGLVRRPSQRTTGASSLTPGLQVNRRTSVGLQAKVRRDNTPTSTSSLNKSESSSGLKSSRQEVARSGSSSGGVKKPGGRSEESRLHRAVWEENKKKFDVLALVTSQVLEEKDKLVKSIKKNKLQFASLQGELETCKVSFISSQQKNPYLSIPFLILSPDE